MMLGLCGNFDGDATNDIIELDGTISADQRPDPTSYANKWR